MVSHSVLFICVSVYVLATTRTPLVRILPSSPYPSNITGCFNFSQVLNKFASHYN